METLFEHSWVALIVITVANALIMQVRSRGYIARDPSLEDGYRKLFWGVLIWGNIPWIIIGLGRLTGCVSSMENYLHPRDGNPLVLGFYASVLLIWALGTYWLIGRGGAELIFRHPGQFFLNYDFQSPMEGKLVWCFFLTATVVGANLLAR